MWLEQLIHCGVCPEPQKVAAYLARPVTKDTPDTHTEKIKAFGAALPPLRGSSQERVWVATALWADSEPEQPPPPRPPVPNAHISTWQDWTLGKAPHHRASTTAQTCNPCMA